MNYTITLKTPEGTETVVVLCRAAHEEFDESLDVKVDEEETKRR